MPLLLAFLDLVGALIADRILSEATTSAETNVQAQYGAEGLIGATSAAPGIDGPTPKIPADSHIQFHSATTAEASRAINIKEARHASD